MKSSRIYFSCADQTKEKSLDDKKFTFHDLVSSSQQRLEYSSLFFTSRQSQRNSETEPISKVLRQMCNICMPSLFLVKSSKHVSCKHHLFPLPHVLIDLGPVLTIRSATVLPCSPGLSSGSCTLDWFSYCFWTS